MRVVLIACSSQKLQHAAPARELYTSSLFTKSLAYARAIVERDPADEAIFVMSAQHQLVPIDRVIAPYDRKLTDMRKVDRMWWGIRVVDDLAYQLAKLALVDAGKLAPSVEHVVLLGGQEYTVPVRGALARRGWPYVEPLTGLQVGERLAWLNAHTPVVPPPAPAPREPSVIIPKGPPIFKPTLPYAKQSSSTLHGWVLEIYDPNISETQPVKRLTSTKKFTHDQKRQALQNYRYTTRKETDHEDDQ